MIAELEDIVAIYQSCKQLQQKILKGNLTSFEALDYPDLNELSALFRHVIHFAETHLVSAHDVFYGLMLMNFEPKIDFTIRGSIDTVQENDTYSILYNPLFILNYSYQEFVTLLVAEMLRFVYGHPIVYSQINETQDKEQHQRLEHAAQVSLSSLIASDIKLTNNPNKKLKIPSDFIDLNTFKKEYKIKDIKSNQDIEYYYQMSNIRETIRRSSPSNKETELADNSIPNQKLIATPNNNQGRWIHQWYTDGEASRQGLYMDIQHMLNDTLKSVDEQQRQQIPTSVLVQIKKMLKPPAIPWTRMLKKYLGTIPSSHRTSKMRLNRRQPFRSDLSGTLSNRLIEIVLVIDTSGSMRPQELTLVMNEIHNIVKHYQTKITLIEADDKIQRITQPKNLNEVIPNIKGQGGTYFTSVINYINAQKTFKNALMIYFTDGYGEMSIPKPLTYRNLWIVFDDVSNLSLKEPYGQVVSLRKTL